MAYRRMYAAYDNRRHAEAAVKKIKAQGHFAEIVDSHSSIGRYEVFYLTNSRPMGIFGA